MLATILGASILENTLAGRKTKSKISERKAIRAGEDTIRPGEGTTRAGQDL